MSPAPTTPPAPPVTDADLRTSIDALLTRYGELLGRIAADPAGAPPLGSPLRTEWDDLVRPGSALSLDVLDRFHRRATVDRVVIVPGLHGITFSFRAISAVAEDASTIRFDWCGWSPGIGRRIDDGVVVDEAVTSSTGNGSAVLSAGTWQITELEERDRKWLDADAPDPCGTTPGSGGEEEQ